jgi:hypothetical protein
MRYPLGGKTPNIVWQKNKLTLEKKEEILTKLTAPMTLGINPTSLGKNQIVNRPSILQRRFFLY